MADTNPIWRIQLFGSLRLACDGRDTELPALTKSRALLAYLALFAGKAFSREHLIDFLWSEEDPELGRQRLRRCLYDLRALFGEAIVATRQSVHLNSDLVSVDAIEFERSLSSAAAAEAPADRRKEIERAIGLYLGELLPGFSEQRLVDRQRNFADRYALALVELTAACEQLGDLRAALKYGRSAVAADPLSEEKYCTLMRLHAGLGRPSDVLKVYKEIEHILNDELGEAPSDATRSAMQSMRRLAQENAANHPPAEENGFADPAILLEPPTAGFVWSDPPRKQARTAAFVALIVVACSGWAWWQGSRRSQSGNRPPGIAPAGAATPAAPRRQAPVWVKPCVPNSDEKDSEPTAMAVDAAGNVYITGFVNTTHNDVDYLTLKYAPDGTLLWRKRYNGKGNDVDRARSIALDADGNVYVTGDSDNGKGNHKTNLSGLDIVTIKYSPGGEELWVKRWNGQADGEDRPARVRVDNQGNVLVAGFAGGSHGEKGKEEPNEIPVILKYDRDGRLKWQVLEEADPYHGGTYRDLVVDSQGYIYAVGNVLTDRNFVRNNDIRIAKYAPDGEKIWERQEASPNNGDDGGRAIAIDGAGNIVITGYTYSGDRINGGSSMDILTVCYDPSGDRKWRQIFDGTQLDDSPHAIAVDAAGAAVVAGWATTGYGRDFLILKYGPDGKEHWRQIHNGRGSFDDEAYAVAVDSQGNIAATGRMYGGTPSSPGGTDWDCFVVKYNSSGTVLWTATYDASARPDHGVAIVFDRQGNVIVTGQSQVGEHSNRIVTIKYPP